MHWEHVYAGNALDERASSTLIKFNYVLLCKLAKFSHKLYLNDLIARYKTLIQITLFSVIARKYLSAPSFTAWCNRVVAKLEKHFESGHVFSRTCIPRRFWVVSACFLYNNTRSDVFQTRWDRREKFLISWKVTLSSRDLSFKRQF